MKYHYRMAVTCLHAWLLFDFLEIVCGDVTVKPPPPNLVLVYYTKRLEFAGQGTSLEPHLFLPFSSPSSYFSLPIFAAQFSLSSLLFPSCSIPEVSLYR